jgi:glycosyltransferase involved in cell wall biosynthesis
MLVSAYAGPELRRHAEEGDRPVPEFLRLEDRFGVSLLDWSALRTGQGGRSLGRSLRHVTAAMRVLDQYEVVLSDGEHLGIPLALAMGAKSATARHVMIGHQLVTRTKEPFFKLLKAQRHIDRLILHSRHHLEATHARLGIARSKLCLVPYGIDDGFWRPQRATLERLVLAPGRDHRDFATLARACAALDCKVFATLGSLHSRQARAVMPEAWPSNFDSEFLDFPALRDMYSRASVVVVPMMPVDYPAGVTSVLEGMAMGRAVVASATSGLDGLIEDGETGRTVPPGDSDRLADVVEGLLNDPAERARLGANARQAVIESFGLDTYCARLAEQMERPASSVAPDSPQPAAL